MTDLNYQGKQVFEVQKYLCCDPIILKIEVDFNVIDEACLHEINQFWDGENRRLAEHDNNILFVILDLAADTAINYWLNNNGMISTRSILSFAGEGWPLTGINLCSLKGDDPEPQYCEIFLCDNDKKTKLFDSEE